MPRPILLCTVGTSLFYPNLAGLPKALAEDDAKPDDRRVIRPAIRPTAEALAGAYDAKDWAGAARHLAELPATERLCGAEVNSVAGMVAGGFAPAAAGAYLFHSDTADGRAIAAILAAVLAARGHAPVEAVAVPGLQDADPEQFRTHGLRNLARLLAAKVREHGPGACAINATGGYKAQVAVAAQVGLLLDVPVYYLHERFGTVIEVPPVTAAELGVGSLGYPG